MQVSYFEFIKAACRSCLHYAQLEINLNYTCLKGLFNYKLIELNFICVFPAFFVIFYCADFKLSL